MRIMVISSCTNKKAEEVDSPITLDDFQNPERLRRKEFELKAHGRAAGEMYTGRQHLCLMRGIAKVRAKFGRESVCLKIVSAGYGLISEDTTILPYDATFQGMARPRARSWARALGIADAVRKAIQGQPLVIFLLGESYLNAIDLPIASLPGQRLIFVAKPVLAGQLSAAGVTLVPAGEKERKRFGDRHTALKGRLFELYAECLCDEGVSLWERTCADTTPATFLGAADEGLRLESARRP